MSLPPEIASLLAAAAAQPLHSSQQVIQPVLMTTPESQRTMAYLQHSIAPLAAHITAANFGILDPFRGPFPIPSGMPSTQPAFPSFALLPDAAYSSAIPVLSRVIALQPEIKSGTPSQPTILPLETKSVKAEAEATETTVLQAIADPPTTYTNLVKHIADHGSRIPLPTIQAFSFSLPLEPNVRQFVSGDIFLDTFALIEYTCRRAATLPPDPTGSISMVDVAKHLINFFSAVSQLPGWMHVERYISNTADYLATTQIVGIPDPTSTPNAVATSGKPGAMDELIQKGASLMMRLGARIHWVLSLQPKAQKRAEPEVLMRVISADRVWASDSTSFMKEAEVKVTAMLTENQPKFHQFREHQRKGVQWPHSSAVRKEIESTGLVFRPMMIKRDRCLCETCEVEVSGWRAWHSPWAFHNYTRHKPEFMEKARKACASQPVVMVVLDDAKAQMASSKPPVPRFDGSIPETPATTILHTNPTATAR